MRWPNFVALGVLIAALAGIAALSARVDPQTRGVRPGTTPAASAPSATRASPTAKPGTTAIVTFVSDGDTIRARSKGGKDLGRIRMIGINAPEIAREGTTAQCWSNQARIALASLAPIGSTVTLVPDPDQGNRDKYGRLLRYIDTPDGDVGAALVAAGDVRAKSYRGTPVRFDTYVKAQREAKRSKSGLWGSCA